MIISKINYTNEEIRTLRLLAARYIQVTNEATESKKDLNFNFEEIEEKEASILVCGLSDANEKTVIYISEDGTITEKSKKEFYSMECYINHDYKEVSQNDLFNYAYDQYCSNQKIKSNEFIKQSEMVEISEEAIKLKFEKYQEEKEKEHFNEGIAEELIKGNLSIFTDQTFTKDELLTMYRYVERLAVKRYLITIKYNFYTAIRDLEEILTKFTITDLKKALRSYNKNLIHNYPGYQIGNSSHIKEKCKDEEEQKKAQLALSITFCIADLSAFFYTCEIVIEKMIKELTEERLNSKIFDLAPLIWEFAKEDGTIINLKEEMLKTPLASNLYTWVKVDTSEEADKLSNLAFARLSEGYLKQREEQNKKLREKRTRRKGSNNSIENQITIEEFVNDLEEYKPPKKELDNIYQELSIQKINNITDAVNNIGPKQKLEDIEQQGIKKAHYQNGDTHLIIGPDEVKRAGQTKPELVLKYMRKNSPKIMSYGLAKFYEQNNKDDLLKALNSKDRPSVTVRFSLNDMMRHFGKDPDNATARNDFKKEWAETCGLWQRGTLRVEGSKGFSQASIISEFGAERGENGGNLYIVFPRTVWQELLYNNTGEFYLPWTRYKLDILPYQIYLYIASHAQNFKNVANDKAPITLDRKNNRITIHRSVKSILENVASIDLEKYIKADSSHILRDIARPFENALDTLCNTPFYSEDEQKDINTIKTLFVSWKYKEDNENKKMTSLGVFESYHDWLNSILVIEMNIPDNFQTNFTKSTKNKIKNDNKKNKKKDKGTS